jgi:hypothetical protein
MPKNRCGNNINELEISPELCYFFASEGVFIASYQTYEIFRPMIKLPGMNGYIKILNPKKENAFKQINCPDGDIIVTYDIEIPFCFGSLSTRASMNFSSDEFKPIQVLRKLSYINAGSQIISEDTMIEENLRYIPLQDKMFCPFMMTSLIGHDGYTDHVYKENGMKITYPNNLIQREKPVESITLTRPTLEAYNENGKVEVIVKSDVAGENILYDHKLSFLVNNDLWNFDKNKYVSYVNNEIPVFNFKVNLNAILNYYPITKDSGIGYVDQKRFILVTEQAMSYIMDKYENILSIQNTKSNIVLEIWDYETILVNGKKGNWRRLSLTNDETYKKIDKYFYDTIVTLDSSPEFTVEEIVENKITSIVIGILRNNELGLNDNDILFLENTKNLILVDKLGITKLYYIIYAKQILASNGSTYMKLYIKDSYSNVSTMWANYNIDPNNIVTPLNFLGIATSFLCNSKNNSFSIKSEFNDGTNIQDNYPTYLDIRDESSLSRYIDNEGYILLRTRIVPESEHPVIQLDNNNNEFQFIGNNVETIGMSDPEYIFNPWYNSGFDNLFDYKKINIKEHVKSFGLNYFKITSN